MLTCIEDEQVIAGGAHFDAPVPVRNQELGLDRLDPPRFEKSAKMNTNAAIIMVSVVASALGKVCTTNYYYC